MAITQPGDAGSLAIAGIGLHVFKDIPCTVDGVSKPGNSLANQIWRWFIGRPQCNIGIAGAQIQQVAGGDNLEIYLGILPGKCPYGGDCQMLCTYIRHGKAQFSAKFMAVCQHVALNGAGFFRHVLRGCDKPFCNRRDDEPASCAIEKLFPQALFQCSNAPRDRRLVNTELLGSAAH